jgi:Nucleotidyltransferase domain.
MEGVFRFREALRARALALAKAAAEALPGTIFLVGSFARGDFSEDSDVDLLVVAEFSEPPHRRLLDADIPPGVEVVALTLREALRAVERCYPIARDLALGVVLNGRPRHRGEACGARQALQINFYPGPAEALWMLWFCLLAWWSF